MAHIGKLVIVTLIGAQLGEIVASLIAPGFLTWYATPGAGSAMCECASLVRDTVGRVVQAQMVGASIGGASSLALGIAFVRMRGKRAPAPAAPAS